MLHKLLLAVGAMILSVSVASAEEVKGEFVKFADGKLTISVDGKDKEFKVPGDLKVMVKKEQVPAADALSKIKAKAKQKIVLTEEKGEVKNLVLVKKEK